jgi:hypothetical protein
MMFDGDDGGIRRGTSGSAGMRRRRGAVVGSVVALLACVGSCGGSTSAGVDGPPCAGAFAPKQIATASGAVHALDVQGMTLLAAFFDVGSDGTFAKAGDGSILLVDLATGAMRPLAKGRSSPGSVSATARFAYWIETGITGSLTLMRARVDGWAGAEVVAPVNGGPTDTVAAGDTLYFSHDGALAALASDASVPTDLVPDALPLTLASDADYIYWTACGGIKRMPKGGGSVQQIDDMSCSLAMATDGADVYFVQNGQLRRVPAGGGTASVVVADGTIVTTAIAMDANYVYYATGAGLFRIGRAGGNPARLAGGTISDIAVDDACVYWGDEMQPGIFVLRK